MKKSNPAHSKRTATTQQIAETLEVNAQTIRTYVKKGLPCSRRGNALRFDPGEVADWMESQRLTGNPGNPDQTNPDDGDGDGDTYTFWRREKEKEHVLKLRQQRDLISGTLVPVADVTAASVKKIHAVKEAMFAGVPTWASDLRGMSQSEMRDYLEGAMRGICERFAGGAA